MTCRIAGRILRWNAEVSKACETLRRFVGERRLLFSSRLSLFVRSYHEIEPRERLPAIRQWLLILV